VTPRMALGGALTAGLAAILVCNSVYVVGEGREAVLTRLGAPVAVVSPARAPAPGLYLKWPFVERAVRLDDRIQALAATPRAVRAAGGERLDVRALVAYRIADPVAALQAGGTDAVRARLDGAAGDALAAALQGAAAADLLAGRADPQRLRSALAALAADARAGRLGVQVSGLTLDGASLSDADAEAAAGAEQATLARAAVQARADGEAARQASLGAADHTVADIRGDGEAAVLRARGQGDAERAQILGAAYAKDPAFAAYLRRLDAYDSALNPATTTLVLSPDSNAFLSTFGQGPGSGPAAAPGPRR
jgi:membrane protease subunit HflC